MKRYAFLLAGAVVLFAIFVGGLIALQPIGRRSPRQDTSRLVLRTNSVTHVGGCHVKTLNAAHDQQPPFIGLKFVCGLPETDLEGWLKDDPRWSTHPTPPLAFTMNLGDCVLLEETYYCVESVRAGEATLAPSFKKTPGHETLITRIVP